jgi:hypothetical protein
MQHLFDCVIFTFFKILCVAPTGAIAETTSEATFSENGDYDQC